MGGPRMGLNLSPMLRTTVLKTRSRAASFGRDTVGGGMSSSTASPDVTWLKSYKKCIINPTFTPSTDWVVSYKIITNHTDLINLGMTCADVQWVQQKRKLRCKLVQKNEMTSACSHCALQNKIKVFLHAVWILLCHVNKCHLMLSFDWPVSRYWRTDCRPKFLTSENTLAVKNVGHTFSFNKFLWI